MSSRHERRALRRHTMKAVKHHRLVEYAECAKHEVILTEQLISFTPDVVGSIREWRKILSWHEN